jgi:hypothetical protein
MWAISIKRYLTTWFTSRNDHHPNFDFKTWESIFSKDRNVKENTPYIDRLRAGTNSGRDDFSIFWLGTENEVPFRAAKEVEEFCRGTHLDDLESTMGTERLQRRAWLDDRSFLHRTSSGYARKYQNMLSAAELRKHLKVPV